MYGEARKLHLIQAILKIDNEAILTAIETIVDKDANDYSQKAVLFRKMTFGLLRRQFNIVFHCTLMTITLIISVAFDWHRFPSLN
jgi:hypothetical protein